MAHLAIDIGREAQFPRQLLTAVKIIETRIALLTETDAWILYLIIPQIEIGREGSAFEGFPLHIAFQLPASKFLNVVIGLIAHIVLSINQSPDAIRINPFI